jgi:hypothetical protein
MAKTMKEAENKIKEALKDSVLGSCNVIIEGDTNLIYRYHEDIFTCEKENVLGEYGMGNFISGAVKKIIELNEENRLKIT